MSTAPTSPPAGENIRHTVLLRYTKHSIKLSDGEMYGFLWSGQVKDGQALIGEGVTWPAAQLDKLAPTVREILAGLGIKAKVQMRHGFDIWGDPSNTFELLAVFEDPLSCAEREDRDRETQKGANACQKKPASSAS